MSFQWRNKGVEGFLEQKRLLKWVRRRAVFSFGGENGPTLRLHNQEGDMRQEIFAQHILQVDQYIRSTKNRSFVVEYSRGGEVAGGRESILVRADTEDACRKWMGVLVPFVKILSPFDIVRHSVLSFALTDDQMRELSKLLKTQKLNSGDWVIKAGAQAIECSFLKQGRLALFLHEAKQKNQIQVSAPVQLFGETVFMETKAISDISVQAPGPVEILRVSEKKLQPFKKKYKNSMSRVEDLLGSGKGIIARLKKVSFLSNMSENLLQILLRGVHYQALRKDEVIFYEGEVADGFYIVYSGAVDVLKFSVEKRESFGEGDVIVLNSVKEGGCFGEIALCMDVERTATIVAKERTLLIKIPTDSFKSFLKAADLDTNEVMRKRIIQSFKAFKIPFFEAIPEDKYISFAKNCEIEQFEKGEVIFAEEEVGDKFYIISRGEVAVIREGKELASLRCGRYFGEVALVIDTPRTATCIAKKKTTLMSMSKENFRGFFENAPEALADAEIKIAGARSQIRSIIYHPKALKLFIDYLQTQWASESIEFWVEVRRFRKQVEAKLVSPKQLEHLARHIVTKYLENEADKSINISAKMRSQILERWERKDLDSTLFIPAETEIVQLLDRDKFASFKRTPEFAQFLRDQEGYGETPITPRSGESPKDLSRRLIRRGGSMLGNKKRTSMRNPAFNNRF